MTILVTGGCGFIGTNFIINWLENEKETIVNLDNLNYASNVKNLEKYKFDKRYFFIKGDFGNEIIVSEVLQKYTPTLIINFAAETHVDRSISNPKTFINTNVNGTLGFLNAILLHWKKLNYEQQLNFRLLHISTDEVYGSLESDENPFTESYAFKPNNPYSASKAASDHLVRAFYKTYKLPSITINCSNNYGPYQFPEKLIPLTIRNILYGKPIPIYGDGKQIRDWLYVEDHCNALRLVLRNGIIGQTYNIGGNNELKNIEIVEIICNLMNELKPFDSKTKYSDYKDLIKFVEDRPGHDKRYLINASKIKNDLGWQPKETFESGITKTILWYMRNFKWLKESNNNDFLSWIKKQYKNT